jgi:hypothetical protein
MARTAPRPSPTREVWLQPVQLECIDCRQATRADYVSHRVVTTLDGLVRLTLQVRRCHQPGCVRHLRPVRPEEEGAWALPQHEFGLDVIALVGLLRYSQHRSVPEIQAELELRQVSISVRNVTNLLNRYDELLALHLSDNARLQHLTSAQGRVVLALDGLQPDVGHEVLWLVRDCISGEPLRAKSLLSATQDDLAALLKEVLAALRVPIAGVISDGQHSIRRAVAKALPGTPHQLCHFHYLREAVRPLYEADRHAKKELKKKVRGVRPIERSVEGRTDTVAEVTRGYCAAVRSAVTDDHRPPLKPSGLLLHERLDAIEQSLRQATRKRGPRKN